MDRHALQCRTCALELAELTLIRNALKGLNEGSPRATYKLQLANCLQLARQKRSRFRARTLAVGLAIAAALVVVLWPEQPPDVTVHGAGRYGHFDLALDSSPSPPRDYADPVRSSNLQIRVVSY